MRLSKAEIVRRNARIMYLVEHLTPLGRSLREFPAWADGGAAAPSNETIDESIRSAEALLDSLTSESAM